jgi:ketosteroid isomerase-like protein
MRRELSRFACLSLVLAGSVLSAAERDAFQKEDVLAVVSDLMDAGLRRDVARIEKLYPDGYFHTNPDGTVMKREDVLAAYTAPAPLRPAPEAQSREDDIVRRIASDTAIVNSRVILKGHAAGEAWERRFRVTWVLVRAATRWQVVNSHASLSLPSPAPESGRSSISPAQFEALMSRLADAWARQDTEAGVSFFTEDAIYMQPPDQQLYLGRAQLRPLFGALKAGTFMTFHHLAFDEKKQFGFGEFSFGNRGDKDADHGVVVVELREGQIAFWREYFYGGPPTFEEFVATGGKSWKWTIRNYP